MTAINGKMLKESVLKYIDVTKKRDLCPIYKNVDLMDGIIAYLAEPFRGKVDYVSAPESLGFILGSALARELGVGFIPFRNCGLSYLEEEDSIRASYIDHNNNIRSLQARKSNFPAGSKVLIVDDFIETAATMQACMTIVEEAESTVVGLAAIGAKVSDATRSSITKGFIRCVVCNSDRY